MFYNIFYLKNLAYILRAKNHVTVDFKGWDSILTDELPVKDSFEDEIADTFIRLMDLCGAQKIDIEWHIKQKLAYNRTRAKKHGKEY